MATAEHDYRSAKTHPISKRNDGSSHTSHANPDEYKALYKESVEQPAQFWDKVRPTSLSLSRARCDERGGGQVLLGSRQLARADETATRVFGQGPRTSSRAFTDIEPARGAGRRVALA